LIRKTPLSHPLLSVLGLCVRCAVLLTLNTHRQPPQPTRFYLHIVGTLVLIEHIEHEENDHPQQHNPEHTLEDTLESVHPHIPVRLHAQLGLVQVVHGNILSLLGVRNLELHTRVEQLSEIELTQLHEYLVNECLDVRSATD